MRILPRSSGRASSTVVRIACNAPIITRACSITLNPSAVGKVLRGSRVNNCAPKVASMLAMAWLAADWVMPTCSAAAVMLP